MSMTDNQMRQAFERFRDEYSIRGFSEEWQRQMWAGEYWDETYVPNLNNPDFQYYKVDAAITEALEKRATHVGAFGKLGQVKTPLYRIDGGGSVKAVRDDTICGTHASGEFADLMCADNKGGELRPLPPFEPFTAEKARKHMQSTAEFIHVMGRVIEHIQAAANLGKWGTEVLIVDDAHVVSAIDTAIHCDNMSRITSVIIKALEDFGYDVVIEPDTGALCITWFKE